MNIAFNFKRFLKLYLNEWLVNGKKIFFFWLSLISLAFFFFGMCALNETTFNLNGLFVMVYIVLLIFQGIIISIHFGEFTSKTKTQAWLLQPASQNETFMAKTMITMVIYPVMAIIFMQVFLHAAHFYNVWAAKAFELYSNLSKISIEWYQISLFLFIWLFVASAFLSGVTIFRKLYMIKVFLVLLLYILLLMPITRFFYFFVSGDFPETYIPFISISEKNGSYFSLEELYPYFYHCILFIMSVFMLVIARVKYNEKTI